MRVAGSGTSAGASAGATIAGIETASTSSRKDADQSGGGTSPTIVGIDKPPNSLWALSTPNVPLILAYVFSLPITVYIPGAKTVDAEGVFTTLADPPSNTSVPPNTSEKAPGVALL